MSERHIYFEKMKELARQKRELYNVRTVAFGLREVRKIYSAEGIRLDYYQLPNKIKALYMCADGDHSVAIKKTLPEEPKLFALIHELKHHYCDQDGINKGKINCGDYNQNELIEIGAEVFAAEFIYPEKEFSEDIQSSRVSTWTPDAVVLFKRHCKAKVSYQFICKRLERFELISRNQFKDIKFQNLEYKIFGLPYHLRHRFAS